MRTRFRSLVAAVAVTAAALTGGALSAAPASAAPARELQYFTLLGNNFGTFGDHDFCRGSLNVRLSSPKRGVTRFTLTSNGFTGNGSGWVRNPKCSVLIGVVNTNSFVTLSQTFYPATFGAKPGEKVVRDIKTGSGFRETSIGAYVLKSGLRVPQSYGTKVFYVAP